MQKITHGAIRERESPIQPSCRRESFKNPCSYRNSASGVTGQLFMGILFDVVSQPKIAQDLP